MNIRDITIRSKFSESNSIFLWIAHDYERFQEFARQAAQKVLVLLNWLIIVLQLSSIMF
jgi:hypothetical protein